MVVGNAGASKSSCRERTNYDLDIGFEQAKLPDGATIAPIILSSDKTHLSVFQGDKSAWPVYITIGNISKEVRRQPSAHATILLGYLPVAKLECYQDSTRSLAGYNLFHFCMTKVLSALVDAGNNGIEITCGDGLFENFIRFLLRMWRTTRNNVWWVAVWRIAAQNALPNPKNVETM